MTSRRLPRGRIIGVVLFMALAVALAVGAARIDVPRLTGPVKGDEATYVSMAFSLAKDGDLKFRPEDLRRFFAIHGQGPEGIFLKRRYELEWHVHAGWPPVSITKRAVPVDQELSYGKSFAYPVLAAPFAAVSGLGGMLLLNVVLLGVCVWCAVMFCRARVGRGPGTLVGVAFIAGSVAPVYTVWLTPEMFNFTLVLVAYFLWLYKAVAPPTSPSWLRWPGLDGTSALLLGVATFSKPPNALLIAPIVIGAVVDRRWRKGLVIVALFCAGSAGLFGINELVTGNWSYQGGDVGDRRYFVKHFPYDAAGTPFETGSMMATNEANDERILDPAVMFRLLRPNLWYFLMGRDAGLIPYFFPGVLVGALWLAHWRRSTFWQWTTALACAGSALGLLVIAPLSWNGGGGPIGNRYFLSIYPALLFLLPARVGTWAGVVAAAVGCTFVGAILVHPFSASQEVWRNPETWPLHVLPVELTMMNNLPVELYVPRRRVEVSKDPEVLLYYMDGNTGYQEPDGFWVMGPATADIVIRTERPLTRLDLRLSSSIANTVEVSIGGRTYAEPIRPNQEKAVQFRPDPGVFASQSYQILLRIKTAAGFFPRQFNPASPDLRHLGVFVKPKYYVE